MSLSATIRRKAGWEPLSATIEPHWRPGYLQQIQAIPDLFRYYTLGEAVGALTADDQSANGGDGTYSTGTVPVLGESGWGDGRTSARFPSGSFLNLYSAAFNSGFNRDEFSLVYAFRAPSQAWWAGATHYIFDFQADGNNYFLMNVLNNTFGVTYRGGGTSKTAAFASGAGMDWYHVGVTVSKAADRLRLYINGLQRGVDVTGLPTFTGSFLSTRCTFGEYQTSVTGPFLANAQHLAMVNREMTAAEMKAISSPFTIGEKNILVVGDSKATVATGVKSWRTMLRDGLYIPSKTNWTESPAALAFTGISTHTMRGLVDGHIAAMTTTPNVILYNLGVNDASIEITSEFPVDTNYILDAYHAAFPSTPIKMARVWRRDDGGVYAPRIATMNNYIDTAVLPGRTAWLSVGLDESTILPGDDNGATNTDGDPPDGIHYSTVGSMLIADGWQLGMGY